MHQFDNVAHHGPGRATIVGGDRIPCARSSSVVRHVGLVGTYPPTECGIATFSANVRDALLEVRPGWRVSVVSLVDEVPDHSTPDVSYWRRAFASSLEATIDRLNTCDTVLLQHEFGIYPGRDGEGVLELVDALHVPLIVSLHTVLDTPTWHQRSIVQRLIDAADMVVVPSESALERLRVGHAVRDVTVIAHGATANFADDRHLASAPTVLTWGLLGPGKGLEQGIEAVAQLGDLIPVPRYVLLGRTHPNLRDGDEDPYRRRLEQMVSLYGLEDRVYFDDRYLDWDALRAIVRRASVVLMPYQSRDQISSGVLVEALASGKPVVATRFAHAMELLSSGAGLTVDFEDVDAMSRALRAVLSQPGLAQFMGERSREVGHTLLWPHVGRRVAGIIEELTERVRQ